MTADAPAGKAAEILDAAELRMRRGGYDAVSFRDLAQDVGIKSASVHYHFPQKVDLGEAVVARYSERVLAALGPADDPAESPRARVARLCGVYRSAAIEPGLVCLCCVLGGQALDLPTPVSAAIARHFEGLLDWTARALEGASRTAPSSAHIVAGVQGAMVVAIATGRRELFEVTCDEVLRAVGPG